MAVFPATSAYASPATDRACEVAGGGPEVMAAVRLHGVHDARLEQLPVPRPDGGDALVRVAYAGICGSDLHVFGQGMFVDELPMIMGHEFSGVVAQVGPEVRSVAVGDRVIGDPRVGCGACAACRAGDTNLCTLLGFIGEVRPGCFAEYVAMSASKLVPLPPDANLRDAAVVEPLAVAVHVMAKLAPRSDEELLILGAGPIGLLCTLLANRAGALVTLCDPSEERLRLGAALQPRQSRAEPTAEDESRYRVVIEAAGRDAALGSAVAAVRPGGRIGLVGIYEMPAAVDLTRAVGKEACLMGLSAYGRGDLQEAARLVRDPRVAMGVRRIVTHELPLKDAAAALARLVSGWTPGKVLLRAGGMP